MKKYHVKWRDRRKDGTIAEEGWSTGARDGDHAVELTYELFDVVEIVSVSEEV